MSLGTLRVNGEGVPKQLKVEHEDEVNHDEVAVQNMQNKTVTITKQLQNMLVFYSNIRRLQVLLLIFASIEIHCISQSAVMNLPIIE